MLNSRSPLPKQVTLADLARDLNLTKARISQLRARGLVVVRRGLVDVLATLERLRLYWIPSRAWRTKRVGPIGQELRRRWHHEAEDWERARREQISVALQPQLPMTKGANHDRQGSTGTYPDLGHKNPCG